METQGERQFRRAARNLLLTFWDSEKRKSVVSGAMHAAWLDFYEDERYNDLVKELSKAGKARAADLAEARKRSQGATRTNKRRAKMQGERLRAAEKAGETNPGIGSSEGLQLP